MTASSLDAGGPTPGVVTGEVPGGEFTFSTPGADTGQTALFFPQPSVSTSYDLTNFDLTGGGVYTGLLLEFSSATEAAVSLFLRDGSFNASYSKSSLGNSLTPFQIFLPFAGFSDFGTPANLTALSFLSVDLGPGSDGVPASAVLTQVTAAIPETETVWLWLGGFTLLCWVRGFRLSTSKNGQG